MVDGRRERKVSSAWTTEAEAVAALAARQAEIAAGQPAPPAARTLGAVATRYLAYKRDQGKRSVAEDQRILEPRLLPTFGPDLNVRQLSGRGGGAVRATPTRGGEPLYTVANALAVLRHCLRLPRRWGYLETVPDVVLPRKPEGRRRFLSADELARLLDACRASRNRLRGCGKEKCSASRGSESTSPAPD
jgi:hypothetical protein